MQAGLLAMFAARVFILLPASDDVTISGAKFPRMAPAAVALAPATGTTLPVEPAFYENSAGPLTPPSRRVPELAKADMLTALAMHGLATAAIIEFHILCALRMFIDPPAPPHSPTNAVGPDLNPAGLLAPVDSHVLCRVWRQTCSEGQVA